ncbi:sensor histidine kinase [Levilactobacillus fujinensis]|uniref:histidine kinase n=1 Tax=Levilactobacillus fujinensis TaxID=2486024 RepID=A0ABW1THY3_9LACO|nr:HAMP domain-containing sensor histidine kinase [Levilactobacillus fujinensis]
MTTLIIIVLFIFVFILSSVLGLILVDLRHITTDLVYINTHTTNAGVTSNLHFGIIQHLTVAMNQLLQKTHHLQQTEYQREHHLEQMLLNLTHDIKTPLTVATGYVQLIQKRPSTATPTILQRVLDNLSSVNYYLRYLMDFNLVRTKANHLNLESVNVSHFLERELFNFFDDLNAKQITVIPKIVPDLYLTTDQLLLQRIIQNLVGNWLKYAAASATISLDKADEQHLRLAFSNHTAEGLTGDDTLTEQFHTTNIHSSQSLGLGLSIVRSLVTTLGGKMAVKMEKKTFIVELIFRTLPPVD